MIRQEKRILFHLVKYHSITPLEALKQHGCMRLAARIKDLRDQGYRIETASKTVKTRNGKAAVAEYTLRGKTR